MKYTAEPWQFKEGFHDIDACESWGLGSIVGGGFYIAEIWQTVRGGKETATANAARIVECVNACAGIPDPEKDIPDLIAALCRFMEYGDVFLCKVNERSPYEQAKEILSRLKEKP